MGPISQSNGEKILQTHFRTEFEDTTEGRLLHAFRYEWAQTVDLSHILSKERPNTPTLLAQIIVRSVPVEDIETFTHIGRGTFLIYPREKKHLLPMGPLTTGDITAQVTTPSPPHN
jgi:hypothetical protein